MSETHGLQLGVFENVHNFIVAGLNDDLTNEHWTDFERLLRESDNACRLYAQYVGASVLLPSILSAISNEELPNSDVLSPEQQEPIVLSPPGFLSTTLHGTTDYFSSGWPVAYLIATVLVGIGLVIGAVTHVSLPEYFAGSTLPATERKLEPAATMQFVGRITGMVDCQWADESTATFNGASVSLGRRYDLSSGLMEISYNTGAKVILQGPVTYEVEAKNGGFLPVGKLTGKVEVDIAKGFTIHTPTATVTDLGTEFGVEVPGPDSAIVHVFDGSVTVANRGQKGGQLVKKGEAIHVSAGVMRRVEPDGTSKRFIRTICQPLTLLADKFSGAVIDPIKWTTNTSTPRGHASVEQNEQIVMTNRGSLITKETYDPDSLGGIKITGYWTFAKLQGQQDMFQVLTRSDGVPNAYSGDMQNGLEFFLVNVIDGPSIPTIRAHGTGLSISAPVTTGSLSVEEGDVLAFTIVDCGAFGLSFTLTKVSNTTAEVDSAANSATATAVLTSRTTDYNHVVFHNREYSGGRDLVAYLDSVAITAPAKHLLGKPVTNKAKTSVESPPAEEGGTKGDGPMK